MSSITIGPNDSNPSGFSPAPPPPPPPPVPGQMPTMRINTESQMSKRPNTYNNDAYEPPAAIQNAMMTKDKKPFTYTPGMGGKLDLSQIRSPRMARRVAKNANDEGIEGPPKSPLANEQTRPAQVTPPAAANLFVQPQVAVPVFPTSVSPTTRPVPRNIIVPEKIEVRPIKIEQKSSQPTSPDTPTTPIQVTLAKAPTPWLQQKSKPAEELPEWAKRPTNGSGQESPTSPVLPASINVQAVPVQVSGQRVQAKPVGANERVIPVRIEDRPSVFTVKNEQGHHQFKQTPHQQRWGNSQQNLPQNTTAKITVAPPKPQLTSPGTYIVPIAVEGAHDIQPNYDYQSSPVNAVRSQGRNIQEIGPGAPVQSRSFRVLQKLTDTDDDIDSEQLRKLQLTEDDKVLMNKFKEQVDGDTYLHQEEDPRYRGAAIPSRAFRYLQNMTDSNEVPINTNDESPQIQSNLPPSEQQAPEPKIYTGSAIPSRSFRILQAMTTPDSLAIGTQELPAELPGQVTSNITLGNNHQGIFIPHYSQPIYWAYYPLAYSAGQSLEYRPYQQQEYCCPNQFQRHNISGHFNPCNGNVGYYQNNGLPLYVVAGDRIYDGPSGHYEASVAQDSQQEVSSDDSSHNLKEIKPRMLFVEGPSHEILKASDHLKQTGASSDDSSHALIGIKPRMLFSEGPSHEILKPSDHLKQTGVISDDSSHNPTGIKPRMPFSEGPSHEILKPTDHLNQTGVISDDSSHNPTEIKPRMLFVDGPSHETLKPTDHLKQTGVISDDFNQKLMTMQPRMLFVEGPSHETLKPTDHLKQTGVIPDNSSHNPAGIKPRMLFPDGPSHETSKPIDHLKQTGVIPDDSSHNLTGIKPRILFSEGPSHEILKPTDHLNQTGVISDDSSHNPTGMQPRMLFAESPSHEILKPTDHLNQTRVIPDDFNQKLMTMRPRMLFVEDPSHETLKPTNHLKQTGVIPDDSSPKSTATQLRMPFADDPNSNQPKTTDISSNHPSHSSVSNQPTAFVDNPSHCNPPKDLDRPSNAMLKRPKDHFKHPKTPDASSHDLPPAILTDGPSNYETLKQPRTVSVNLPSPSSITSPENSGNLTPGPVNVFQGMNTSSYQASSDFSMNILHEDLDSSDSSSSANNIDDGIEALGTSTSDSDSDSYLAYSTGLNPSPVCEETKLPDCEIAHQVEGPTINVSLPLKVSKPTELTDEIHVDFTLTRPKSWCQDGSNRSYGQAKEETDDDDSGVTSQSDLSRIISEVDTDSESGPKQKKINSYKRTQTHSRLFKLITDDSAFLEPHKLSRQLNDREINSIKKSFKFTDFKSRATGAPPELTLRNFGRPLSLQINRKDEFYRKFIIKESNISDNFVVKNNKFNLKPNVLCPRIKSFKSINKLKDN
ncbi:uncharacterized protein LOC130674231 isoform X2 [Microplitis mediator]|uniref:uncharacterized protein LOC130674231 isoform X2 n=1 Tax=Microplitis mediator TaxID=375433 RepID=UPI0025536C31|nr:uncharacterized protein LOC130674231 isoform X2 [Microplitis mediator]